jgi:hypothetical protein
VDADLRRHDEGRGATFRDASFVVKLGRNRRTP